jgi:hypothetical protein
MKQIRDTYKKTGRLHHAYAILGDKKKVKEEVTSFLVKDLKFPAIGNPDFWQGEFNVLKIADSREINQAHVSKPVKHNRKVFIISANFITKDAQNSLLKIFEEPQADTTFFLILPPGTDLLATLKSRIIFGKGEGKNDDSVLSAEDFLGAKVGKRLQIVSKITKDIKDEKITKSDAITFLKNIEKFIKAGLKQKNAHNARSGSLLAVEDIEKAISYAADESPSMKVILEHLALVL